MEVEHAHSSEVEAEPASVVPADADAGFKCRFFVAPAPGGRAEGGGRGPPRAARPIQLADSEESDDDQMV
jgi:hypothetical protein